MTGNNGPKNSHLKAVPTEPLPEPPYPADTKANGFRPEIDWQRIKSSKTWRLCPPEARNHLLRLWLESWNEIPAGSWEDDDEIIAIAIDMAPGAFAGYRQHLMRGWVRHGDGRLYHPFVTEMVQTMLSRRRGATERVARYRARKEQEAAAETPSEPSPHSREVTESNALPPVTYAKDQEQEQEQEYEKASPIGEAKKTAAKSEKPPPPPGLDTSAWDEYLAHRRAIKAGALKPASITRQQQWLAKQGPPEVQREIVAVSVRNGWTGLFELKAPARGAASSERDAKRKEAFDMFLGAEPQPDGDAIPGECTRE